MLIKMLILISLVLNLAIALTEECFTGETSVTLQLNFYQSNCPPAEDIIFSGVQLAVADDPRMAASLLRLHFHDCFVLGCDASVLLDDVKEIGFAGEKTAAPNVNSLRGFEVIDSIKSNLEQQCPGIVSCADLLAIAARDSVLLSGGPTWQVEMGRKDSLTASLDGANNSIPGPNSNLSSLVQKFQKVGLSPTDMVALSGGHTIGKARCATFAARLSGDASPGDPPNVDTEFLQSLQQLCAGGNSTLATLDLATPTTFDNSYYVNLLSGQGLLPSDQALVSEDGDVARIVENYALDPFAFFEDFKMAMLKMGRIGAGAGAGTGVSGEVRRNCRFVNQ